jgi:catechol 2,3-dioxygenase-like lactoylglutathione lyase family enzyme
MIEGLSHLTFIVKDLEQMTQFLTHIFDAEKVYSSGEKTYSIAQEKFFLINTIWIAIMQGDSQIDKTYNHVAFKIQEQDFDRYVERVRSLGVELLEGRSRVTGEGQSCYFYDYDNHLFELHTGTLHDRLMRYSHKE